MSSDGSNDWLIVSAQLYTGYGGDQYTSCTEIIMLLSSRELSLVQFLHTVSHTE